MIKAIGYSRVSTIKQVDEGFSIEGQEREILDYCVRNNIRLIESFTDGGKTGANMDRDGFQDMIDYVISNNVDIIVTYKLSRFSRSQLDLLKTIEKLERYNVDVHFVSDGLNTGTQSGKFMTSTLGAFAEMERENILEFTHMGSTQNALSGNWNGGRSLGYRSSNKQLFIHEEESEIIKIVFDLYVNKNYGLNKIARYLNKKGIKTLRGKNFSTSTIGPIIDNPVYKGFIRWTQNKGKKNEKIIMTKGNHEAIIDEVTWGKAQKRRKLGKTIGRVYEGDYLLSGIVKCPTCGGSMVSHSREKGKYRYYRCLDNIQKGVCQSNLLLSDNIDNLVLDKIIEIVEDKRIIKKVTDNINKKNNINPDIVRGRMKQVKSDIRSIERNKEEIFEEKMKDKINLEQMNNFLDYLDKQEKENKEILDNLIHELEDSSITISADEVRKILISKLKEIKNKDDIVNKKKVIASIIKEVLVIEGNLPKNRELREIVLFFEPDDVLVPYLNCVSAKGLMNRTSSINTIYIGIKC